MRIFITLLTTFLLIGCSADPNDYDYNLKKSDVVCNLIKKEKEVTTGRYTREYMRETYKCSFITCSVCGASIIPLISRKNYRLQVKQKINQLYYE